MNLKFDRARHIWMDELPPHLQEEIRAAMKPIHLQQGEFLIHQGDDPTGIYELESGRLKAYFTTPEGKQVTLNIFTPRIQLGEANLISGTPFAHTAEALGDTEVRFLCTRHFNRLRASHPELDRALVRNFSHKLMWMNDYMVAQTSQDLKTRLAGRLCRLVARDTADNTPHACAGLRLDCSQEDLAALLGTTRQSINKTLKSWQSQGIVENHYRSLVVNDLGRLQNIAAGI